MLTRRNAERVRGQTKVSNPCIRSRVRNLCL